MKNIGEIPSINAKYYPGKRALVDRPREFTWKELNERINQLANALLGMGCEKGDRIAIIAYNSSEYIESIFASAKAGLIFVPLNFRLSVQEIEYILHDSTPKVLLFDQEFSDIVSALRGTFPLKYIAIGDKAGEAIQYEKLINSNSVVEPCEAGISVDEDDPAEILYTSGTTGSAKGVVHSHRARLAGVLTHVLSGMLNRDDVHLVNVPPLFHTAGYVWMLANAYVGASIIISRLRGFDPEAVLRTIQEESVTNLHMVPITVMELIDFPNIGKYDFSSLRLIYYATAPMPAGPLKKALSIFGNIFMQPYGLTEAGPTVTCLGKKDHDINRLSNSEANTKLRSCGRPFFGRFVKIVDEKGEEVPHHTVGEIIVKSPDIMECYWNNEAETRRTIKDDWLYTGDMATYDEDYYIFLVDRKKDMIISGGENIYSAEVERVIYEHPSVVECAVIGVPDERWGEAVKAFVVVRKGKQVSEEEIIQFCKKSLASYKKPKSVEFVTDLPRNPTGKILKKVLREKYWVHRERKI
jgi:long-chain acyl-CoA synthetase